MQILGQDNFWLTLSETQANVLLEIVLRVITLFPMLFPNDRYRVTTETINAQLVAFDNSGATGITAGPWYGRR